MERGTQYDTLRKESFMEEWKAVEGTKGMIEVSSDGRVRSLLRGTPYILKTQKDSKGYHRLRVTIEREKKSFKLHRMVAQAFVPNPEGLPQVNHIDGNKSNNNVSNLEWISNTDNAHHAIANGLWESVYAGAMAENERRKKAIIAKKGEETIAFSSISDAERYFGSRHITDVLKGKRQRVKGWTFSYVERG